MRVRGFQAVPHAYASRGTESDGPHDPRSTDQAGPLPNKDASMYIYDDGHLPFNARSPQKKQQVMFKDGNAQ